LSGRRSLAILVLLLPVVLTAGLGVAAGYAVSRAIRIPRVSELASYRPDIVTEIRGSDGSPIARYAIERRVLVGRQQIPDVMVKALLAAEDARFFEHGQADAFQVDWRTGFGHWHLLSLRAQRRNPAAICIASPLRSRNDYAQ
jgi:membrane carboxypeptidase/penicillin-binding protein